MGLRSKLGYNVYICKVSARASNYAKIVESPL